MFNDIKLYGCNFLYNSTIGVAKELSQVGWAEGGYRAVSSISGLEKTDKFLSASLKLIPFKEIFGELGSALSMVRDVIYATMVFDASKRLVSADRAKDGLIPVICSVLNATASVFETGGFLKKYAGFQFKHFTELSNKMGAFTVNGIKPFSYKPLNGLVNSPKGFCVLISSSLGVAHSVWKFVFATGNAEKKQQIRNKELSVDNLVKQAANLGRVGLIWFCDTPFGKTKAFAVLDFVTQSASLINVLIKKPS